MLLRHPAGQYRFLPGIEPYSGGVRAAPGFELVRAVVREAVEWSAGFELIEAHLGAAGLPREALCAAELRCPAPFTLDGFADFNRRWCTRLRAWGLLVGDANPIARTHVAPLIEPPPAVHLHAFSYVRPAPTLGRGGSRPSFVVAGAGELRDGILDAARIVRAGETSAQALLAKMEYVLEVIEGRLRRLGVSWSDTTVVTAYTAHAFPAAGAAALFARLGRLAGTSGLRWVYSRPPVEQLEFEMDARGVWAETWANAG